VQTTLFTPDPADLEAAQGPEPSYAEVLSALWESAAQVCLCFVVTLGLFPGLVCEFVSTNMGLEMSGWFSILLMLCWNVCDYAGRSLPKHLILFRTPRSLWPLSLLRVAFIPWFIDEILHPKQSDPYIYFMVAMMGITNGYASSLAMMYGNSAQIPGRNAQLKVGTVMTLALNLGLFLGAALSNPYSAYIQNRLN
jgi:hypothetical protein